MLSWLFGKTPTKEIFVFGENEGSLTPTQLGYYSVKLAIDSTTNTVGRMADSAISRNLQERIAQDPGIAQLHLILYELGACYVYCSKILNVKEKNLSEILAGYKEGLSIMRKGISPNALESMLGFIRVYAQELNSEISNPGDASDKAPLGDASPSASIVLREIFSAYDPDNQMNIQRLDELALYNCVTIHGMLYIGHLNNDLKLEFKH